MPTKEKRVVLPGSERAAMPGASESGAGGSQSANPSDGVPAARTPLKKISLTQRPRLNPRAIRGGARRKRERHQEGPRVRERIWFEGCWKKAPARRSVILERHS